MATTSPSPRRTRPDPYPSRQRATMVPEGGESRLNSHYLDATSRKMDFTGLHPHAALTPSRATPRIRSKSPSGRSRSSPRTRRHPSGARAACRAPARAAAGARPRLQVLRRADEKYSAHPRGTIPISIPTWGCFPTQWKEKTRHAIGSFLRPTRCGSASGGTGISLPTLPAEGRPDSWDRFGGCGPERRRPTRARRPGSGS